MIQRESQRLVPSICLVLVPRALQSKSRDTEHVEGSNFDDPSRRTAFPNCTQGASMHACIPHRQAPMQTSLAQRQAANAAWHQCGSTSRSATELIWKSRCRHLSVFQNMRTPRKAQKSFAHAAWCVQWPGSPRRAWRPNGSRHSAAAGGACGVALTRPMAITA